MKKYFIIKDDKQLGPFSIEELKEKLISKSTLIWFDGCENWVEAGAVESLSDIIKNSPPPIPTKKRIVNTDKKKNISKEIKIHKKILMWSFFALLFINIIYFLSIGAFKAVNYKLQTTDKRYMKPEVYFRYNITNYTQNPEMDNESYEINKNKIEYTTRVNKKIIALSEKIEENTRHEYNITDKKWASPYHDIGIDLLPPGAIVYEQTNALVTLKNILRFYYGGLFMKFILELLLLFTIASTFRYMIIKVKQAKNLIETHSNK